MKILVIRACAVGDFVFNLPALQALQNVHRNARFTLVGYPATLEIAGEFITVERIFSIEADPWRRLFYEPVSSLQFDSAVVWMTDPVVANNLRFGGVSPVLRANAFASYGHAVDHLLRTLGLPRPVLPDLWMPGMGEVVVNTGSGSPKKNWPFFEDLIARLPAAVRLPQGLTLRELARYLGRCGALVGNDSGITHLAAYWGCPTIALFGPTDPRMWGPIGRRARVIWKTGLENISVDEVLLALQSMKSYGAQTGTGING